MSRDPHHNAPYWVHSNPDDTTQPCARGCTIRDRHADDCPGNTCTGCQPRPAQHGVLCTPCHGILTRALYQAPGTVTHLRNLDTTSSSGDAPVRGTREQPIPLNTAAVDAADELHAMLASWVNLILDLHPDCLHGPDTRGSRLTEPTKRRHTADTWVVTCADCHLHLTRRPTRDAAITAAGVHVDDQPDHVVAVDQLDADQAWHAITYTDAQVAGLMPGTDADATHRVTTWLLTHLPWCERQPWVTEMAWEIPAAVATLLARFPTEEGSRAIPDVTCPVCGRMTLTYHPPTTAAADVVVQCDHHACSAIIPEEHWGLFVRRLIDEAGPRPAPEQRQPHRVGHRFDGYGGAA